MHTIARGKSWAIYADKAEPQGKDEFIAAVTARYGRGAVQTFLAFQADSGVVIALH